MPKSAKTQPKRAETRQQGRKTMKLLIDHALIELNKNGAAANRNSRLSDGSDDTVADAAKPGTKQTPTRKKTSPVKKEIKKEPGAEEVVFRALRGGGKPLMPYTQSEVSLVALDREGAW